MDDPGEKQSRDDRESDNAVETPSHSGASGGMLATEIGARDEEKAAMGEDPEPARATKQDKIQSRNPTRSDHEGGAR